MDNNPRYIDVLLFDGLNVLEIAGPAQAFSTANTVDQQYYRVRYVSIDGEDVVASCGLRLGVSGAATGKGDAQDLIIPGGHGVDNAMLDPRFSHLISQWIDQQDNKRIIAVCSGALLLAQTGLLDGRIATTHWGRQTQACQQFPQVNWAVNQLYCVDGPLLSSAGVTSGIDLSLEIIRRDCGPEVALRVARQLVVYLKRDGGQAQFSDLLESQFAADSQLTKLINAIVAVPAKQWTLEAMSEVACMTPRTLTRRFVKVFGRSPHKYLERLRVKLAADALSSGAPISSALNVSGFGSFQQLQRAFKRQLDTTVGAYQNRFNVYE